MSHKLSKRLTDQEVVERVIYRDALMIALNKPSGIPVHPANGSKHNLEQYFHLLQFGLKNPPALAHRLDLGTSGCLLLARHKEAARRLQILFTEGKVKKAYVAHVHGSVLQDEGTIDIPLSKLSPLKKHWWMKADPNGLLTAVTQYRVIARQDDRTVLSLFPITGRTHQLRVHCAALGHPIIGDYIYGVDQDQMKPLYLHAHQITVPLYPKKPAIEIKAPLPPHMNASP